MGVRGGETPWKPSSAGLPFLNARPIPTLLRTLLVVVLRRASMFLSCVRATLPELLGRLKSPAMVDVREGR
jgi:hypothetical protein